MPSDIDSDRHCCHGARRQSTPRVAVIIPCLNEEATIADVVTAFSQQLPGSPIVVVDNGSHDRTAQRAIDAGAHVLSEPRRGKGHAVRALLSEVEADLYLMVDGDSTYEAEAAPDMVAAASRADVDLVLGSRTTSEAEAYRTGHQTYNRLIGRLIQLLYGRSLDDPLTGYRCLTRRFARHFPARSPGFTTEIEMDLFALEAGYGVAQVATHYRSRPENSPSKLNSIRDGARILALIALGAGGRLRLVYGGLALAGLSWVVMAERLLAVPKLDPLASLALLGLAVPAAVAALASWLRRSRLRRHLAA